MRFSMNSQKWVSGLMAACLALPLVGCAPEASTPATKPTSTATSASNGVAQPAKEQAGSTVGGASDDKGREVPEPNPADSNAEDKPASEQPKEE